MLYFSAIWKLAAQSPGRSIQRALCAFGIFHFLFLTDLVDYRFGRGITNSAERWCHWLEMLAWIIAILLPVYQKLTTQQWRRGNGRVGVTLHYALAAWAAFFFVYEFVIYFVFNSLYQQLRADEPTSLLIFGLEYRHELGYIAGLTIMVFLYGYMAVFMRCKRFVAEPLPSARAQPLQQQA